jgi:cellulose biosynthesis protein BcsQ
MLTTIAQAKGGVGETTSAINIGVLLACQDRRVLLVDADPQAALTRQLGIDTASSPTLVDVLSGAADSAAAIRTSVPGGRWPRRSPLGRRT